MEKAGGGSQTGINSDKKHQNKQTLIVTWHTEVYYALRGNPVTDSLPRINKTLRTRARSTTFLSLSLLPFDFFRLPRTVKHGITFQRLYSYPRRETVHVRTLTDRCRYFGGFPDSATRVCRFDSRSHAAPIGRPSASIVSIDAHATTSRDSRQNGAKRPPVHSHRDFARVYIENEEPRDGAADDTEEGHTR